METRLHSRILIARSEEELQLTVNNLQKTVSDFNMKLSSHETKIMAFQGQESIRSKIYTKNLI